MRNTICTLREIKLIKADLRRQLKYDENLVRYQAEDFFSEVKSTVANIALIKSIAYVVGYFVSKKREK